MTKDAASEVEAALEGLRRIGTHHLPRGWQYEHAVSVERVTGALLTQADELRHRGRLLADGVGVVELLVSRLEQAVSARPVRDVEETLGAARTWIAGLVAPAAGEWTVSQMLKQVGKIELALTGFERGVLVFSYEDEKTKITFKLGPGLGDYCYTNAGPMNINMFYGPWQGGFVPMVSQVEVWQDEVCRFLV